MNPRPDYSLGIAFVCLLGLLLAPVLIQVSR